MITMYYTSISRLLELTVQITPNKVNNMYIRTYLGIVVRHWFYSEYVGPHITSSTHKSDCGVSVDVIYHEVYSKPGIIRFQEM